MVGISELDLERIAGLVIALDELTLSMPRTLKELKSVEGQSLARQLPGLSEALRLAIVTGRAPRELTPDVTSLEQHFRRLSRLSLGARMSAVSKAGVELGVQLTSQLKMELSR